MRSLTRFVPIALIALLAIATSSCELIGGIFEAGVWSGVILVVGGILLVGFVLFKLFGGKK